MKIALDVDGVLASFESGFVRIGNQIWPGRFDPAYVPTTWEWSEVLTPEEMAEVWKRIKQTNNFWASLPPYMNEVDTLRQNSGKLKNHELFYLTSRPTTHGLTPCNQTLYWLRANALPHGTVIVVGHPNAKALIVRALAIDTLVDDYPPTVGTIHTTGLCSTGSYLMRRKWNQTSAGDLLSVGSIKEYLEVIGI